MSWWQPSRPAMCALLLLLNRCINRWRKAFGRIYQHFMGAARWGWRCTVRGCRAAGRTHRMGAGQLWEVMTGIAGWKKGEKPALSDGGNHQPGGEDGAVVVLETPMAAEAKVILAALVEILLESGDSLSFEEVQTALSERARRPFSMTQDDYGL